MNKPADSLLAAHLLVALYDLDETPRLTTLDALADRLSARRSDVRRVASALHGQGMIDILRLRLTMRGLALAATFSNRNLRPLRQAARAAQHAA